MQSEAEIKENNNHFLDYDNIIFTRFTLIQHNSLLITQVPSINIRNIKF